ncbi:MAG: acetolactate synthase large subunit [Acidobacteria bacterium]|nr:acetolactate synthase large subunit [Acidobacteriota bacterium]
MNGAEVLLRTLLANRIDLCFMNPGTSEMQFVSALDRVPAMRGVLCLHEGVCAGAADGYARMTGRPAAVLLHLWPGLANGLSNFHNARKARSPIVNIVGEHATAHLRYDAPLTADVAAIARPFSGWVRTLASAAEMGQTASACIQAAYGPPGQVSTLIVPADHSWSPAGEPGPVVAPPARAVPASGQIEAAAAALRQGDAALFLGGIALLEPGLAAAARIHAATGARVFTNRYAGRSMRGAAWSFARRLAYFPEPAEEMLAGLRHIVLVETEPPVSFFGYPGRRSTVAPEGCHFTRLAAMDEDGSTALEALANALHAPAWQPAPAPPPELPPAGPLTPESLGRTLAALLPEGAIVSDEMVSCGEAVNAALASAACHDLLPVTGGSIGQGLPVAVGAALACPGRKVVAVEADGSGLYTPQALWTMARESLDVTVVILANRRYRILEVEMRRTGASAIGPRADEMIDIARPAIDWTPHGRSLGVDSVRAATVEAFAAEFTAAMRTRGPRLIEAVL